MSQSPESLTRRPRYESGWDAIHRMIRENGSWSGRERNCAHLACPGDTFVDVSYLSGLDFIEDGRAFAVFDMEGDGDPDLLVRSRNGYRLRVLRNEVTSGAGQTPAVWFKLEGPRPDPRRPSTPCTTAAVGARVDLETEHGVRRKHVRIGNGYVAQSTSALHFGLRGRGKVQRARVVWPDGTATELPDVKSGHLYRVRYGEAHHSGTPFTSPSMAQSLWSQEHSAPTSSTQTATWLIEPYPALDFDLEDAFGRVHSLAAQRGSPTLLVFLSLSCALCRQEVDRLTSTAPRFDARGVKTLAICVDPIAPDRDALRQWVDEHAPPFPVVLATEEALTAWNVFHQQLWSRRRDLAVPLAFLLNRQGLIERAYRGAFPVEMILEDAGTVDIKARDRLSRALPFSGNLTGPPFQRDRYGIGTAFAEAGLPYPAITAFLHSISRDPNVADAHYNLGLAYQMAGDFDAARSAYERAVSLRPDFVDAINNIGFLLARAGQLQPARRAFRRALASHPEYTEAILNLAATHVSERRSEDAVKIYRQALKRDGENTRLWVALGYALLSIGRSDDAVAAYRTALRYSAVSVRAAAGLANALLLRGKGGDVEEADALLEHALRDSPGDIALLNARGQAAMRQGKLHDARRHFETGLVHFPNDPVLLFNLARVLAELEETDSARETLRRVLAIDPDHGPARSLLRTLRH